MTKFEFDIVDGITVTMAVKFGMVARMTILPLATGTHNLKLRYRAVNGGHFYLSAFEAGYILLGK